MTSASTARRVRFALPTLVASLTAVACLLLSATTPVLTDTATASAPGGGLVIQEHIPGHTCTSGSGDEVSLDASTCAAINALGDGAPMIPGRSNTTNVTITNLGAVRATTFTLAPAEPCVQTSRAAVSDLCSKISVVITSGRTTVFAGTAASLGRASSTQFRMPEAPAAGGQVPITIVATLDPHAGNGYMGLQARLPVRWTLAG